VTASSPVLSSSLNVILLSYPFDTK
jgi:hypothetical protein